jgi:hypothetical protein
MALMIAEILGRTHDENEQVPVVLNPSTVEGLQPLTKEQMSLPAIFLAPRSTGVGNRVGTHVEDRKRTSGMGHGFVMTVTTWNPTKRRRCEENAATELPMMVV